MRILECTLRDGSYTNNFQFTRHDTAKILTELETAGFNMIELGHGVGLGASESNPKLMAAETDEVYLETAAKTVKNADWGMFCIPGIAKLSHVDMAHEYGMKFIRIGINVNDYKKMEPFVSKAKQYGIYVCANLMKSYVVPPEQFAKIAAKINKYGVDLLYIVDSSGGMLPNELEKYIKSTIASCPDLDLGFHGHNNLGLAVANSILAVESGVSVIDTTMQGLGRSAGNAPTEHVLSILLRKGINLGIEPIKAMDIGERHIQPILAQKGLSSIDTIAGLALFHSSYMPTIKEYSSEYNIDPRKLILMVCKQNQADAPEDVVKKCAQKLESMGETGEWQANYQNYIGGEQ